MMIHLVSSGIYGRKGAESRGPEDRQRDNGIPRQAWRSRVTPSGSLLLFIPSFESRRPRFQALWNCGPCFPLVPYPLPSLFVEQSKITREELENQRQLLVDLRHEIGELKSIHQAGVVGSKGGGTRGGYGTAMPASEFFKQGVQIFPK